MCSDAKLISYAILFDEVHAGSPVIIILQSMYRERIKNLIKFCWGLQRHSYTIEAPKALFRLSTEDWGTEKFQLKHC